MLSLAIILLPSKTVAIKTESSNKRIESEYQGDALADFHAKVTAAESICIKCIKQNQMYKKDLHLYIYTIIRSSWSFPCLPWHCHSFN